MEKNKMSKKQEAKLSLDREDLDAQLEAAAQKRKKQKRKKVIIRVVVIAIILLLALLVGAIIIGVVVSQKAQSKIVNVSHVENSDLTQEVKISGIVQSDNIQHFFAPVALKVESVVEVGTYVKKGDPIITFDAESYELALKQVELNDKITENNYQSSVANNNNTLSKLAQAQADVVKYQAEVNERQAIVDNYDENGNMNQLNKDIQTQIGIEQGNIAYYTEQIEALWVAFKLQVGYDSLSQGEAEQKKLEFEKIPEVIELREKIAYSNQVIQNVSGMISDKTESLAEAKANLAESKSKLESAKAQVESYKQASGNGYDRENLQLQGELSTLKSGSEYEELLKYENGCLVAPFDGIVTKSFVSEGMTTSITGSEMIEFSSINEVSVAVSIGKKDLSKIKEGQKVKVTILDKDYEGKVSKIARVAIAGNNGAANVSAIIKITNPDEDIFLGIEAKNVIETAHEDDCMCLASESVNVDGEGYFVYTVNDMNIIEKKRITVGITTEDKTQIIEGVDDGDKVVSYVTSIVQEGATVVPVDQDEMNKMIEAMNQNASDGSEEEAQ